MQDNPGFKKNITCPTNEALLLFLQGQPPEAANQEAEQIVEHLAICEFCELSLELLRDYPLLPELASPPAPPPPQLILNLFPREPVNE